MSGGELYERRMSEPLISELDSSSLLGTPNAHPRTHSPRAVDHGIQLANQVVALLPTPSSEESTPTDEFVEEMRAAGIQPDERLYLPGRKWHSQRTLSRIAPALLPTPNASDGPKGGPNRADGKGTPYLTGIKNLLPTPAARDGKGPNPNERKGSPDLPTVAQLLPTPVANPDNPGAGGELRAALTHGPGRRNETGVDTMGRPNEGRPSKLLPTPVVTDSYGSRRSTARTDEWTSNEGTSLTDAIWETQGRTEDTTGKLLPTHRVNATRSSRKAMVENKQWSAPSLEQALELSQGKLPREFQSWDEVPGWSGELMSPPSEGGSTSSDDPPQLQLTIEDA